MTTSIPSQTSLSNVAAYTTWPGGIDPTVSVYRLPTTGGKRSKSRKVPGKACRKATRKVGRKGSRKAYRKSQHH